jgi:hypothetical protein
MSLLVVLGLVAGCSSFPAYRGPDREDESFRRLGCLDVYVRPYEGVKRGGAQTLSFAFGNRCREPVTVDVRGVSVRATVGGVEMPLAPSDPRGELREAILDGFSSAREVIVFEASEPEAIWTRVCVHLDRITAFRGRVSPVCLEPLDEIGET